MGIKIYFPISKRPFESGLIPGDWVFPSVVPIFSINVAYSVPSYEPVLLISTSGKIIACIVLKHILTFC